MKQVVRDIYKQLRFRMSKAEVKTKSRIINRKLLNEIDWRQIENACVYNSIVDFNEVDIKPVVARLREHGIKVYHLGQSKTETIPEQHFDLILVPCLAFDRENYRLGWGGGFYDRFLARQSKALKIGLCYQNGFVKEGLPHEPHDIQLDKVITEV
jgi:5-formyltetrahydrofolate cyclo-ligase